MAVIRKLEINNFRGIKNLSWFPRPGVNCLIGPGDSGKTTILDALDFCLSARRNLQFSDADFYNLDIDTPIVIVATLGDLDDKLKNIDAYGQFLQGLNPKTGEIEDEPGADLETVLSLELRVESDLEPQWSLTSSRAEAEEISRNLNWQDRIRIAPTRLGNFTESNLSWRRGSILNRISDERADASAVLAKAARDARTTFGDAAKEQLEQALKTVKDTATDLGIPVGAEVKAMLEAHSVSFSGGTISLHDESGVPLRGMGLGSIRLLIAGLQKASSQDSSILLVDELEQGLEPHRIVRFLDALGAKDKNSPLQVFVTTHSPVAVRELSGEQLFVLRRYEDNHHVQYVGAEDGIQGTVRLFPEALLAPSVIICEGASEVGLVRGLDQWRSSEGQTAITAQGVAIVDGGGSGQIFKRAKAFLGLGYRTAVLRDSDVHPTPELEQEYIDAGGVVFAWREGLALEQELFLSLSDEAIDKLLNLAIELKEDLIVNEHIKTASENATDLLGIQADSLLDGFTDEHKKILGKASSTKNGWFKTVGNMETAAREIIGPDLANANSELTSVLNRLFDWFADAPR